MTQLEKNIKHFVTTELLYEANELIKTIKSDNKEIEINFINDGVNDALIYDTEEKRFTKIRYKIGIGEGQILQSYPKNVAYFNDFEYKYILM